jgi:hypothetical protein
VRTETRSEKARQVILKAEEKLYYVSSIKVQLRECQNVHRATFHVQAVEDNQHCDLDFEIQQNLYDMLVEYTKLGNPDLILLLFHENNTFTWSLISESWVKHWSNIHNLDHYVV